MKQLFTYLLVAIMTTISFTSFSQARLQVIHNSADPVADTVDVWLNNTLLIDDFAFRTASPFIDAPAGVDFDVVIQPSNSMDTTNALARFTYNLMNGSTYVIVANGIVNTAAHDPAIPFDLHVYNMGREMASQPGNTDVLVFHGASDAPVVDIYEVNQGISEIVDNFDYGDFEAYLELPSNDYALQVRDSMGMGIVAEYAAPLKSLNLMDSALVVVASGFLNPAANNDGAAFGLFAALPQGGELVELPSQNISTSKIQVIHNSPDMAAEKVDIWVNADLFLDDFMFRKATPFVDVPAGVDLNVYVQPSNSTDTTNALAKFTYNLDGGENYILIASGLINTTDYDPFKAFNIDVFKGAQYKAAMEGKTDVLVYHGSTDAPSVAVAETAVPAGDLISSFEFSDFEGYLSLDTEDYVLELKDESRAGMPALASYEAPLKTLMLENSAITVVASGFLDPMKNNDGPAFGLFVALPKGGDLVALSMQTTSIEENSLASISNAYPNPATEVLNVEWNLEEASNIRIEVYNVLGSKLISKDLGTQIAGKNTYQLNVNDMKEGVYFINVISDNGNAIQKFQVR